MQLNSFKYIIYTEKEIKHIIWFLDFRKAICDQTELLGRVGMES